MQILKLIHVEIVYCNVYRWCVLCFSFSSFLEAQKWQNRLIIPAIIEKLWISKQPIAWQVNNLRPIKGILNSVFETVKTKVSKVTLFQSGIDSLIFRLLQPAIFQLGDMRQKNSNQKISTFLCRNFSFSHIVYFFFSHFFLRQDKPHSFYPPRYNTAFC